MTVDVGQLLGASSLTASGWSIDTRSLSHGDVFFALRGACHDGHEFVGIAAQKGAAAVVVDHEVPGVQPAIVVEDTQRALQSLAAAARQDWGGTVVAVTGSAGKTTTKDYIARMLQGELAVGKTAGNFNNHIGVPLSILRLPDACRVAVLEMGMNHAGEIRELCQIARPEIGVVTNAGFAHVENFDSIDEVAAAKRELIESLPASGTAVLNADDPRVSRFGDSFRGRVITYGLAHTADVCAVDLELEEARVSFTVEGTRFAVPIPGVHTVRNVLAGVAVAKVFGIAAARLTEAAAALTPGRMRGERMIHKGVTIWNDAYNSNPEAVRSMLDVLAAAPALRRVAVLGEMLELGQSAGPLHREIGRYVAERGIDVLVGVRGAARLMVDEAMCSGLSGAAYFFETPEAAGDFLRQTVRAGDGVLFKGSRGVRVEKALERMLA